MNTGSRLIQPPLSAPLLLARWKDTIANSWAAIASRRRRGGDWTPHVVYVVHLVDEKLYKVGVSRASSRRLTDMTRGHRTLVDRFDAPNGYVARLLEATVLVEMFPHRVTSASLGTLHGKTECWHDRHHPPALDAVHAALTPKRPPVGWTYSVPELRSHGDRSASA